jgi:tetratricopeptide (TPR) repeat protein
MNDENRELASALLFLLGEQVPHDGRYEREAAEILEKDGEGKKALLQVISLCGESDTPGRYYLCTKAYSRLGEGYSAQTVRFARAYLATPGWDALPSGRKIEEGIQVDLDAQNRAGIYEDLADACSAMGRLELAISNYKEAFRLEPYNAMYAVKAANAMARIGKPEEARDFLLLQKRSFFYRPFRYRDALGRSCVNDEFRRTIDFHLERQAGSPEESPEPGRPGV